MDLIIRHKNEAEYLSNAEVVRDEFIAKHQYALVKLESDVDNDFDVVLGNGDLCFSKTKEGRFPTTGEITPLIEQAFMKSQSENRL